MTKSLYQRFVDAGSQIDSHYSDLYVPDTPENRKILRDYVRDNPRCQGHLMGKTLLSNVDGKRWIEIPFSYEPYWVARAAGRR